MKPLQLRTANLDKVPEPLREFYRAHGGEFILDAEPDPRIARLEEERDRYREVVHRAAVDEAVGAALLAMRPDPAFAALIGRELRARLKVEDDGDTLRAIVVDAQGKQRELPDGRDMQLADLARDPEFAAEFGRCLGIADSKPTPAAPADVVIPRGADQRDFEAAFATAAAQGGRVVYSDAPSRPSPTAPRDVVLPAGRSQTDFEAAFEQAAKAGGEVLLQ